MQFFTALMLPAFCMPSGLKLRLLPPVVSAPYIDMTARLLAACGIQARFSMNTGELSVSTGRPVPPGPELAEADWSSASYIYEYVALSRRPVLVRGLRGGSLQGDSRCVSLFCHWACVPHRQETIYCSSLVCHLQLVWRATCVLPRTLCLPWW